METFQLLMNTVVIRDSQYSIAQTEQALKQTEQTVFLIRLAAVYLPLSLAIGLFGMNLHEINEATPQVWAFIIVVVALMSLTFAAFRTGKRGSGRATLGQISAWKGNWWEEQDFQTTKTTLSGQDAERS